MKGNSPSVVISLPIPVESLVNKLPQLKRQATDLTRHSPLSEGYRRCRRSQGEGIDSLIFSSRRSSQLESLIEPLVIDSRCNHLP